MPLHDSPHPLAGRAATDADRRIAERVRAARERASLSQAAVARALGITYPQLQKYEAGHNRITGGRLQALAALYRVPVASFFDPEHATADALEAVS